MPGIKLERAGCRCSTCTRAHRYAHSFGFEFLGDLVGMLPREVKSKCKPNVRHQRFIILVNGTVLLHTMVSNFRAAITFRHIVQKSSRYQWLVNEAISKNDLGARKILHHTRFNILRVRRVFFDWVEEQHVLRGFSDSTSLGELTSNTCAERTIFLCFFLRISAALRVAMSPSVRPRIRIVV